MSSIGGPYNRAMYNMFCFCLFCGLFCLFCDPRSTLRATLSGVHPMNHRCSDVAARVGHPSRSVGSRLRSIWPLHEGVRWLPRVRIRPSMTHLLTFSIPRCMRIVDRRGSRSGGSAAAIRSPVRAAIRCDTAVSLHVPIGPAVGCATQIITPVQLACNTR